MPNYKSWSGKSAAAKKLVELFDLYKTTNGAAGINYNLNSPTEITSEVYNKNKFLHPFNPDYFSKNHFRTLRNNWLTARAKDKGRKKKTLDQPGKFGTFLFLSSFSPSHFLFDSISEGESPPKKRRTESETPEKLEVASSSDSENKSETLGSSDTSSSDEVESSEEESEVGVEEVTVESRGRRNMPKNFGMSTPIKKKKATKYKVDHELSSMMQNVLNVSANFSSRKAKKRMIQTSYLPSGAPYLLYYWEDRNSNNRLTLEVLLYGAIHQSKMMVSLGEVDVSGQQKLFLTNPLPPAWLSMREFEHNNNMQDYNTIKQHGARKVFLVELEARHSTSDSDQIESQQAFILPFEVENFNAMHPYEGTGYYLEKRPVVKRSSRRRGEAKMVDIMNILVVNMVAEEKCSKVKKKKAKTTKFAKACTFQGSSSDESDESSDTGRRTRSARNPNTRRNYNNQNSDEDESNAGISYDGMEISLGDKSVNLSFETAKGD